MKNYIYKKLPDGRYLQIEDDGKKAALEHFGVEALIEGLQTGKMSIPEGFVKKLNDGRYLDISNDAIQSEFQKVYGALQGLNGSSGSSGISGTSGTSGVSGTSGTSGINGVDGQNGINGIDGTSGTSGISGTSGVDGQNGINGIDGSSGTSGISGSNGSSGSSGVSGTSGTSGVNGLAGSSGTSGISIIGATGATGPAGRDGKPGQSGGRGPMGPMGLQGPKGDKGDPGSGGASIPRFITSSYSITRANEAMVHDLYIKDQLTIEAGTYSYDFGSASFIDNALLDVEETIWLDGVLEVNGEMNIGDVVGSSGGGSGTSGSSGSSGTSGITQKVMTYSGITQSSKGKFMLYQSTPSQVSTAWFSYDMENWEWYIAPFNPTTAASRIATDGTHSISIISGLTRPMINSDTTGYNWQPLRNTIFQSALSGTSEANIVNIAYSPSINTWCMIPSANGALGFYSVGTNSWATYSFTSGSNLSQISWQESINKFIASGGGAFAVSPNGYSWSSVTMPITNTTWQLGYGATSGYIYAWNAGTGTIWPRIIRGVDTGSGISWTYSGTSSYLWYSLNAGILGVWYNKANDMVYMNLSGSNGVIYQSPSNDLINWATASSSFTINGVSTNITISTSQTGTIFYYSEKLSAFFYMSGSQLWRSTDGRNWVKVFTGINIPAGTNQLVYMQNWL